MDTRRTAERFLLEGRVLHASQRLPKPIRSIIEGKGVMAHRMLAVERSRRPAADSTPPAALTRSTNTFRRCYSV